jgi:hypothetical protein
MKFLLRHTLLCTIVLVLSAAHASAFSRQGHETIGQLGYTYGKLNPGAKQAIDQILAGETISDAAEWPDAIKDPYGALCKTDAAKAFVLAHPEHHLWHFVDFPVGATAYDVNGQFALKTDIVHAVQGCIAVLEGTGSFDGISKLEALRYLVHLVGDAHQPLHTITGYFDISNPAHPKLLPGSQPIPAGAFSDTGGNDLVFGTHELHGEWDDDLVQAIAKTKDTTALVNALLPSYDPTAYATSGDYHHWIEAWVSDSMPLAADAYGSLTFNACTQSTDENGQVRKQIKITLPAGYAATGAKVESTQLLKGGAHLAQLLNAIHWGT